MKYLINPINRIIKNPVSSIFSSLIISLAIIIPTLVISLSYSFAGKAFVEIESIWVLLRVYTADQNNAIFKLCSTITIISLLIGAVVVIYASVMNSVKKKKVFKNYLIMGATPSQVIAMELVENLIILVVGSMFGLLVSWILGVIVGAITTVSIILNMEIFMITVLVYFAIVVICSIVMPIWVNTESR